MNDLVDLALVAWVPCGLVLFGLLPPRRAALATTLAGWLLLPVSGISIAGFPDYTKGSAIALASMLGVLAFDRRRLWSFRPRLLDVPMLVWCTVPLLSSLSNDLGVYDGVSALVGRCVKWGVPYLIGRIYFVDRESLRELAIGIFAGGLLYVPLCLYEIRMSPLLHNWVYGFHQHEFVQTLRFGGYRPMVFLSHGLAVAAWMASASLLGIVLWCRGQRTGALVAVLVVTSLLCKSMNAWVELAGGLAVLAAAGRLRSPWPLWLLLMLAPAYLVARTQGLLPTADVVNAAAEYVPDDRAASLAMRLENEDRLMARAFQRPLLGWGGWGRSRVRDDDDSDITVTDGQWIIALGESGLVGLTSLTAALLLPLLLLLRGRPDPSSLLTWALAVVVGLHVVDNLFNDMFNPVFVMTAGGLSGAARLASQRWSRSSAGGQNAQHFAPSL